ncbi:MAG TPA: DUF1993 family protein [Burkholderiaceae bacterium]|nr:DUF1993 family protein [Burkholderiaceae bacterium]
MSLSMHALSVPVFARTLGNLSAILDKAAAYAQAKKIDPAVLLTARLYPDMFALTRQIQLASDHAKGAAARLAGLEPPRFEDVETTIEQLQARIARTTEFVRGIDPKAFDGAETREISLKVRDTVHKHAGLAYLCHIALPNFFFHVTTAYDILRHNGVELGKRDFIGSI